jgi:luciferase family oxidoreductase group 1
VRHFPQQVVDLLGYLGLLGDQEQSAAAIRAQPGETPASAPTVWLLGSTSYSARLAGQLGLPFAFADFFGNTGAVGPHAAAAYREEFRPTTLGQQPRLNVTVQVVCAPTEAEAKHLALSRRVARAAEALGVRLGLLPPDEAALEVIPPVVEQHLKELSRGAIEGDPQQVRDRILEAAAAYGTDDVGIVTNCYAFADRVRSYELVAQAFELTPWD